MYEKLTVIAKSQQVSDLYIITAIHFVFELHEIFLNLDSDLHVFGCPPFGIFFVVVFSL